MSNTTAGITSTGNTIMEVGFVRRGWIIVRPCGGLLTVDDFELECDGLVSIFAPTCIPGIRGERYVYDSTESLVEVIGIHRNLG